MTTFSGTLTGTPGTNSPTAAGSDGGVALGLTDGLNDYITASGAYTGGIGGFGSNAGGHGGAGGNGVDLSNATQPDDTGRVSTKLDNSGVVTGGKGGAGFGDHGGNGGIGVNASVSAVGVGSTLYNHGAILGGAGGYGFYGGGTGGSGVVLAGTPGYSFYNRALNFYSSTNDGTITGGAGGAAYKAYTGGNGGIGVEVSDGGLFFGLAGTITGGVGAGDNASVEINTGGAGGAGASVGGSPSSGGLYGYDQGSVLSVEAGTIAGGAGGSGLIQGGAGGAGVELADGGTLEVFARAAIVGGNGGFGPFQNGFGGDGGDGVHGISNALLDNSGSITGGTGGPVGRGTTAAAGGIGVELDRAAPSANFGTITGGTGSVKAGSAGGVGVVLDHGGSFENDGTISGGTGTHSHPNGDAVHLNGGDSRLSVDPGAVFNGKVVSDASFVNTLALDIGTGTIGSFNTADVNAQYSGFSHLQLGSYASWEATGVLQLSGAGASLDFIGSHNTLTVDDAPGFLPNAITGFVATDTIDLKDVVATDSRFDGSGSVGVLTIHTSGPDLTLDFANPSSFTGEFFHVTSDGGTGSDITVDSTPCYCPGTRILTDRGEVAVESLSIGDRVITVSGAAEPIHWIGRRSYAGRFLAGKTHILPIRIKAGALGEQSPKRDLVISPLHAMYLDDVLVPAGELVNGVSIVQENVEQVDYIHIELKNHDLIWAEGSASETFIDDDSRMMFHNASEYPELYPEAERTPAQYCAPRLTEGYAVEAIRQRIAQRAGLTTKSTAAPAALRGNIDAIDRDGIRGWAQDPAYPEAAVCLDVLEDGKVIAQVLANAYRADLEQAGLGSGRHAFELRLPEAVHGIVEVRRSSDQQVLPDCVREPRGLRRAAN